MGGQGSGNGTVVDGAACGKDAESIWTFTNLYIDGVFVSLLSS